MTSWHQVLSALADDSLDEAVRTHTLACGAALLAANRAPEGATGHCRGRRGGRSHGVRLGAGRSPGQCRPEGIDTPARVTPAGFARSSAPVQRNLLSAHG